jgi:hypothetical protein
MKRGPIAFSVVGVLLLLIFYWLGGGFITEKRNKYLVPVDYSGWVCIAYGVPGEAPLAIDPDGYQTVRVPGNGIVKTSTLGKAGPLRDAFYLVSPDGTSTRMPGERIGGGGTFASLNSASGVFASYFWISESPKADYERAGSPSSDSLRGRCY